MTESFGRRMGEWDVRVLYGFSVPGTRHGFLKEHGVFEGCTLDDLEQDRQDLRRAGF